jgi:hypothetical protein
MFLGRLRKEPPATSAANLFAPASGQQPAFVDSRRVCRGDVTRPDRPRGARHHSSVAGRGAVRRLNSYRKELVRTARGTAPLHGPVFGNVPRTVIGRAAAGVGKLGRGETGRVFIAPVELLDPGVECSAVWGSSTGYRDRSSTGCGRPETLPADSRSARPSERGSPTSAHYRNARRAASAPSRSS